MCQRRLCEGISELYFTNYSAIYTGQMLARADEAQVFILNASFINRFLVFSTPYHIHSALQTIRTH